MDAWLIPPVRKTLRNPIRCPKLVLRGRASRVFGVHGRLRNATVLRLQHCGANIPPRFAEPILI